MNGVESEVPTGTVYGAKEKSEEARTEFAKRRRVLITNLPETVDEEDLQKNFLQGYDVKELKVSNTTATVLLADAVQAKEAVNTLNNQSFHSCEVGLSFAPPDALLFVGNIPFEFTEEEFRQLMSPFGPIERLLLIRSEKTGKSKGYGFVEYLNRDCATQAKQSLMASGSKYVGGRILRIDYAEPNLISYEDLHSKTLFVDRLPRNFTSGVKVEERFRQSGTVLFAQVAVNPQTGMSRGFAFVDFMTAEEAERAQLAHNGSELEGSFIRVAFGTPGRLGSGILGNQQKNVVGRGIGQPIHPAGGLPLTRPLLGPRPLMGVEAHGLRGGLLGPRPQPPMYRQALLGHGPRAPIAHPGFMGQPCAPGHPVAPWVFPRGSILGAPRGGPQPLLGGRPTGGPQPLLGGRPTGHRGLLGARPQAPMQPQPLMPELTPRGFEKELMPHHNVQTRGLLKDPVPVLHQAKTLAPPFSSQHGQGNYQVPNQYKPQANDQQNFNQPNIPQSKPQPQQQPQQQQQLLQQQQQQQQLLQQSIAVATAKRAAQLLANQQAQGITHQQAALAGSVAYPTASAIQGTPSVQSVPGVSSLMSTQPTNQVIPSGAPTPLMSVPVASAATNYLTADPQYMTAALAQQYPMMTQVFTQTGTPYLQQQQDPTQQQPQQPQPLMYTQQDIAQQQPQSLMYTQQDIAQQQPQPLMYAQQDIAQQQSQQPQPLMYAQQGVLQLQGYPQYMTQAQQQTAAVQQAMVPTQQQMLVQPATALQYQYQWPQPTQPATAQAAVTVPSQQTAAPVAAAQWQQGVVSSGSVAMQPAGQQMSAYAAQYQSYQHPTMVAVQQQAQSATVEAAVLQQPQATSEPASQQPYIQAAPVSAASFNAAVGQKRSTEGSTVAGQFLPKDQSLQYYDANKRPRF